MALVGASVNPLTGRPKTPIFGGVVNVVTGTTLNPADKDAAVTLSNGNLTALGSANDVNRAVRSTTSKSSGKWHFEFTIDTRSVGGGTPVGGVGTASASLTTYPGANAQSVGFLPSGDVYLGGAVEENIGSAAAGTVVSVEIDRDVGAVFFQRQGGTRSSGSGLPAGPIFAMVSAALNGQITVNFTGPFTITPTSGYSAWG